MIKEEKKNQNNQVLVWKWQLNIGVAAILPVL